MTLDLRNKYPKPLPCKWKGRKWHLKTRIFSSLHHIAKRVLVNIQKYYKFIFFLILYHLLKQRICTIHNQKILQGKSLFIFYSEIVFISSWTSQLGQWCIAPTLIVSSTLFDLYWITYNLKMATFLLEKEKKFKRAKSDEHGRCRVIIELWKVGVICWGTWFLSYQRSFARNVLWEDSE